MIKKIIFRLFAVFTGLIFIFFILEIGLRIFNPQGTGAFKYAYDPELGCTPAPYQRGRCVRPNYGFTNNSWGFRGAREYSKLKKVDLRILVLGDSYTYGMGVEDDQTFPALLEKNLSLPGRSVEVINAGMPAKGTDYALKFLQTRAGKLNPDLVILCFDYTDFWDNQRNFYYTFHSDGSVSAKMPGKSLCAEKKTFIHSVFYNWLINWSHLANLVRNSAAKIIIRQRQGLAKGNAAGLVIDYPDKNNWVYKYDKELTVKFLDLLDDQTKKMGLELVIFYLGSHLDVIHYRENGVVSDFERDFQVILKGRGIVNFSTTEEIARSGLDIKDLYNIEAQDYHFSAKGNKIVADFMSHCLESIALGQAVKN